LTDKNIDDSGSFLLDILGGGYQEELLPFMDFFTEYRLESEAEELDENAYYNDEKRYWILQDYSDVSVIFIRSLYTHCDDNSNCIIFIYGIPNSGKSEFGAKIAFVLRNRLRKQGYRSKLHVFFDIGEVAEHSEEFEPGDVVLIDEMPEMVGEGSYTVKKAMNNITKIIRAYQLFFVYISPEKIKFKVVNYYLEMCGKNKSIRKSRGILFSKKYNAIGHIKLPLHKDKEFRKYYEEKKMNNIKKVLASGGNVKRQRDKEKIKEYVVKLLELAKKMGTEKREELAILVDELDIEEQGSYIKKVVGRAWMSVSRGHYNYDIKKDFDAEGIEYDEKDMVTEGETQIQYYEGMPFYKFVYEIEKQRCSLTIAKVRKYFIKGYKFQQIADKVNKSKWFVNEHTSGDWRRDEVGYLLEKWYAKMLGIPDEEVEKLVGSSNPNKPDIDWNEIIYSLKYRYEKGFKAYFSKEKDLGPEWRLAKERGSKFFLVYYNNRWDNNLRMVEVETGGSDDVYVYRDKPLKKLEM